MPSCPSEHSLPLLEDRPDELDPAALRAAFIAYSQGDYMPMLPVERVELAIKAYLEVANAC